MAGRNAAALADLDFAKDDLVRIGWQADGPNFGTLADQSTFIPMRTPNRFTMAAASTAQGGVW
jgi:hypothetical protein